VGMFPEVFGMADGRSESTEGRSKPGVGWRLTSGEFGNDRCMIGACLYTGTESTGCRTIKLAEYKAVVPYQNKIILKNSSVLF